MSHTPFRQFLALALVSFLGCLDFTIVNTALPAIQTEFHASVSQLQWVMNGFLLVLCSFMVMAGRLADLYGKQRVLRIGMMIFFLASLGAGLAPNLGFLIACRTLQAIGIAILYVVPMALISVLYHEHEQAKKMGLLIAINGFGLAIGPVLGGLLVSAYGWPCIFIINCPIVLISAYLGREKIHEPNSSNTHQQRLDLIGFSCLLAGLIPLVLGLVMLGSWSLKVCIALISLATIMLGVFYWIETRQTEPMLDFHLFRLRNFNLGIIGNFSLAFMYTISFFFVPLFLKSIRHTNDAAIGGILLSATVMVMSLSPWVDRLVKRLGPEVLLALGFSALCLSEIGQAFFSQSMPLSIILLCLALFGTGWAFVLSPSIVLVMQSVPKEKSGIAGGTSGTFHNLGGVIGLALATMTFHSHQQVTNGYTSVFLMAATVAGLSLFVLVAQKLLKSS